MDGCRDASTAETSAADAATVAIVDPDAPGGAASAGLVAADTADGSGPAERPPLAGQVSYVFGGALPTRYSAWVLRDLTGPGWRWRQALRPVLMMLPFAIIFALLPGPVGVRGLLVGFLLVAAGALGLGLSGQFRNRRLVQHGFPPVIRPNAEDTDDDEPAPVASSGDTPARSTSESADRDDDPHGVNA